MSVTGTSVAAATTMLAAAAAIFITFVLCFYLFLCAKRYRGAAPTLGGATRRLAFAGHGEGGAAWCHGRGLDDATIAALPRRVVVKGDEEMEDCAVCIMELAAGEEARVLPRCGHGFHMVCVDMWLRSHSTCPLCRRAVTDETRPPAVAAAVQPPEVDRESPNFPTNVLFFGSQDAVSTGGAPPLPSPPPPPPPQPVAGPVAGVAAVVEAARTLALRRLLGCGGATPTTPPPRQADGDVEMGLADGGESSLSPPAKPQARS